MYSCSATLLLLFKAQLKMENAVVLSLLASAIAVYQLNCLLFTSASMYYLWKNKTSQIVVFSGFARKCGKKIIEA